jgi:hypothetical protein
MDVSTQDGSPQAGKTPRKKRGAQPGNTSGVRHGLTTSALPPGCKHIQISANRLRRQLEGAVLAARGRVSLTDAAIIATALRWERHASLAGRWLRLRAKDMSPGELLQFSRDVARASAERDRAILLLKLDDAPDAPWVEQALPALPAGPVATTDATEAADAAEGTQP